MIVERYPFNYDPARPFAQQIGEWIADVLYDILPEHGFEVRDEQIYMAYQLERAFADKRTIFAEAGVGTGKTLVYLMYAVCYARHTGKPAIIACADESLIEQLVKPEGDIAKLARFLDFGIDARLGKSPDQYLCLVKLDEARMEESDQDAPLYQDISGRLPAFVNSFEGMQAFHPYGDRKDYPHLTDEQWRKINWDSFRDCFVCPRRHRCGQTLSRDHYRRSSDLIICSHDYYMEHVWTSEGRKREGQLPLLPEHCAVVFDEGHLLEAASQKALSYKLKHAVFEELITRLLQNQVRQSLAYLIDEAIDHSEAMFALLERKSEAVPGSDRKRIDLDAELMGEIRRFRELLTDIEESAVYESELFTMNHYHLRIVEEHLDMMQKALGLFDSSHSLVCWLTEDKDGPTLSIMPRTVKEVLRERVFRARIPIVFSSATLSVDGSFAYVADSLGISDYLSFSAASPYNYSAQMRAFAPKWRAGGTFGEKLEAAALLLRRSKGRALILFPAREELLRFKLETGRREEFAAYRFLYEGDGEISRQIAEFQHDEASVLCAVSLWEGLDVPGPSLSNVIVWSLPFPPQDPVFTAKRNDSDNPFAEVDLPYMLLRLKQGVGRLIRSGTDSGIAAVFSERQAGPYPMGEYIQSALPEGVALEDMLP